MVINLRSRAVKEGQALPARATRSASKATDPATSTLADMAAPSTEASNNGDSNKAHVPVTQTPKGDKPGSGEASQEGPELAPPAPPKARSRSVSSQPRSEKDIDADTGVVQPRAKPVHVYSTRRRSLRRSATLDADGDADHAAIMVGDEKEEGNLMPPGPQQQMQNDGSGSGGDGDDDNNNNNNRMHIGMTVPAVEADPDRNVATRGDTSEGIGSVSMPDRPSEFQGQEALSAADMAASGDSEHHIPALLNMPFAGEKSEHEDTSQFFDDVFEEIDDSNELAEIFSWEGAQDHRATKAERTLNRVADNQLDSSVPLDDDDTDRNEMLSDSDGSEMFEDAVDDEMRVLETGTPEEPREFRPMSQTGGNDAAKTAADHKEPSDPAPAGLKATPKRASSTRQQQGHGRARGTSIIQRLRGDTRRKSMPRRTRQLDSMEVSPKKRAGIDGAGGDRVKAADQMTPITPEQASQTEEAYRKEYVLPSPSPRLFLTLEACEKYSLRSYIAGFDGFEPVINAKDYVVSSSVAPTVQPSPLAISVEDKNIERTSQKASDSSKDNAGANEDQQKAASNNEKQAKRQPADDALPEVRPDVKEGIEVAQGGALDMNSTNTAGGPEGAAADSKRKPSGAELSQELRDFFMKSSASPDAPSNSRIAIPKNVPLDMAIAIQAAQGMAITDPSIEHDTSLYPDYVARSHQSSPTTAAMDSKKSGDQHPELEKINKLFDGRVTSIHPEEQTQYLSIFRKLQASPQMPLSLAERSMYSTIKSKVEAEQRSYKTFMRNRTLSRLPFIRPGIDRISRKWIMSKQTVGIKTYPRYYKLSGILPIRGRVADQNCILQFKRMLMQVGTCFEVSMPPTLPVRILEGAEPWLFGGDPQSSNGKCMAAGGGDSGSKLDKSASDSKDTDESEDDAASDSDTTAGSTGSGGDDNSDDDGSDGSDGGSSEDNEDGNPAHPAGDGAPKGPMRRKPLSTPTITQDAIAHRLAKEHQVDVVLSTGALVALVLLRSSQAEEVAIPFKIVGEIGDDGGIRKTLVVDKPLPTILSLTPRRRNRLYYDAMLEAMLVDTTKPKTLGGAGVERDLAGLVDTASANLNYTLWQLGDMRIMIRYKVHGYVNEPVDGHLPAQDTRAKNAGDQGKRQSNVVSRTLTIKSKLEYQYDYAPEEISEAERIRWWLSCYVRGTAQMLIGHIDVGTNELVRLERQSLKDILPPAWASLPDACTRYLSFVLARLQEFEPGEYVLTHRKNDVDMRVLASLPTEASAPSTRSLRASTAVQSSYDLWHWLGWPLAKNGDAPSPYVDQPLPTMADESEYVPARWVGAPDKIPYTFPAEPPWYHRSESADDAPEGGYSGEFGGRRSRRKTNKKKKQQRKRRRQQQQQQQQQQGTNIQSENAGTSKRLKVG